MSVGLFYFNVFQTANFMASFLLIFEVLVVAQKRWKENDWSGPTMSAPTFFVGTFAISIMTVCMFLPRVFDAAHVVFWSNVIAVASTNIAITLLFFLVFWFHHYTRNDPTQSTLMKEWRYEHIAMVITLVVSISANVAEIGQKLL